MSRQNSLKATHADDVRYLLGVIEEWRQELKPLEKLSNRIWSVLFRMRNVVANYGQIYPEENE